MLSAVTAATGVLLPLLLLLQATTTATAAATPSLSLTPSPLTLATRQEEPGCVSQDSANQHAAVWPYLVSGNLNGTTLVVPIPLSAARRVVPAAYGILEHAYRALLPASFPADAYPMMAVGVHDHDIQFPAYGASSPDFSVSERSG